MAITVEYSCDDSSISVTGVDSTEQAIAKITATIPNLPWGTIEQLEIAGGGSTVEPSPDSGPAMLAEILAQQRGDERALKRKYSLSLKGCSDLLRKFPNLKKLHVRRAWICDGFFRELLSFAERRQFTELVFTHCYFDTSEVHDLRSLRFLRTFEIFDCKITEAALLRFELPPELERLHLMGTSLGPTMIERISRLRMLEELTLLDSDRENPPFDDDSLIKLLRLSYLAKLRVTCSRVTGEGLARSGLVAPALRELRLYASEFTDQGMAWIVAHPAIERLELSCSRITDRGLESLAGLGNLQALWLCHNHLTDGAVPHLKRIETLEEVDLTSTLVTADGATEFLTSRRLRSLLIDDTPAEKKVKNLQALFPRVQFIGLRS